MRIREVRTAIDYNRALHPALRAVHVAMAAAACVVRPLWRHPLGPLAIGLALVVALWPWDGAIMQGVRAISVSGDVKRELSAWQQYGALTSLLVVGAIIALVDPKRTRRLLDLAAAAALTGLAVLALKMLVARPRPRPDVDDPVSIPGPLGEYPITMSDGTIRLAHGWDLSTGRAVELWSMGSSHTAYAVALSVFLAALYPRLRPLAIALAALVGASRVLFQAHWPTDVVAGAALGFTISRLAVGRMWGVRALDWAWVRWIDPAATPMYPAMAAIGPAGRTDSATPVPAAAPAGVVRA